MNSDEKPYPGKPGCEDISFYEKCARGELDIFSGEKPSFPRVHDNHHLMGTRLFEVSPEQLIDVAKHLASEEPVGKAIEKAYQLICEAHLVSRNIGHWNEKVRNNHVDPRIKKLVDDCSTRDENGVMQCPRKETLVAFEKFRGNEVTADTASDRFNKWIKEEIRTDDFLDVIAWSPHHPKHDRNLVNMLYRNGWIDEVTDGSNVHIFAPSSKEPRQDSRCPGPMRSWAAERSPISCHPTEPYWHTDDIWWPEAPEEELREKRKELFKDREAYFHTPFLAAKTLDDYNRWRDIWEIRQERHKEPSKRTRKDGETGKFINSERPRDDESGRFS